MSSLAASDARSARRADPTRTGNLRRAYRAAAELRRGQLRAQLRRAVVDADILGLGSEGYLTPEHRLTQFAGWFKYAAETAFDPWHWSREFVAKAIAMGIRAAVADLGDRPLVKQLRSLGHLDALGRHELDGIIDAAVQKAGRIAHGAIIAGVRPPTAFAAIVQPLDVDTKLRLKAFSNVMTTKGYVGGKLEVYRAANIDRVGTTAELKPGPRRFGDEAPPEVALWDPDPLADPDDQLVGSQNAGDELVCILCEDYSDDNPHTLDEAQAMIPLHPGCRCTVWPWDDKRFAGDE